MPLRLCLTAAWLAGMLAVAPSSPAAEPQVRIYRCTDAAGKTTLRDTPCRKGESTAQVRDMLRPRDPPPRPQMQREAQPAATAQSSRVIVLTPPQPMFECVDPDGRRYTSATGDGNPRWVPFWTLYHPPYPDLVLPAPNRLGRQPVPSVNASVGRPTSRPPMQAPMPPRPGYGHGYGWPMAQGGGTWIADTCHPLPQAEVCDRLRDRRSELRTRRFNAQERERLELEREERTINARLGNDCGG